MSINFKPINEVPEVESLSEGDKLLVNSNGAAKQIDASKVGGSGGGGGVFYAGPGENENGLTFMVFADKELTKTMTFAEGMAVFESGPVVISVSFEGTPMFIYPLFASLDAESKVCFVAIYMMEQMLQGTMIFSDSVAE